MSKSQAPGQFVSDPDSIFRELIATSVVRTDSPETMAHVDMRLPARLECDTAKLSDLVEALLNWGAAAGAAGRRSVALWLDAADPESGELAVLATAARTAAPAGSPAPALPARLPEAASALGAEPPSRLIDAAGIERIEVRFRTRPAGGSEPVAGRWGSAFRNRRLIVIQRPLLEPERVRASLAEIGMEAVIEPSPAEALAAVREAAAAGRPFDFAIVGRHTLGEKASELVSALRHDPGKRPPAILLINRACDDPRDDLGADAVVPDRTKWRRLIDVLFDLSRERAQQRSGGAAAIPSFQGRRILIAEDVTTNRALLRAMLAPTGATCTFAGNGVEAVASMQSTPSDLVLMDIQMPVMDGMEATRQIRALGIETRIIALTANARDSDRERYLACGMDGYLAKPIRVDDLYQILGDALQGAG